LVCVLNAVGASGCYMLSSVCMRPIVDRCLSQRLLVLRRKVRSEEQQLFMFLLGARILPFCPHWLLNMCSPFVGISLPVHAATVLVGWLPS
uniref:7TM_GPCR_Srx domain-containing protein n=1 Tax=Heligmosomoides polygyrus TaxID=6339 RepID=A0A183GTR6_HELPZ